MCMRAVTIKSFACEVKNWQHSFLCLLQHLTSKENTIFNKKKDQEGILKLNIINVVFCRHRIDPVGLLVEGRIIPEKPAPQTVSILRTIYWIFTLQVMCKVQSNLLKIDSEEVTVLKCPY